MLDGKNLNRMAVIIEADAVVADAQTVLRRFDALKTFDVTLLGLREARQGMKDTHCSLLVDSANIGPALVGPGNPLAMSYCSVLVG